MGSKIATCGNKIKSIMPFSNDVSFFTFRAHLCSSKISKQLPFFVYHSCPRLWPIFKLYMASVWPILSSVWPILYYIPSSMLCACHCVLYVGFLLRSHNASPVIKRSFVIICNARFITNVIAISIIFASGKFRFDIR